MMVIRPVTQLKPGARLTEDVHTPLGGLLFRKGSVLDEREIEILHAFLVHQVAIESDEHAEEEITEGNNKVSSAGKTEMFSPLFTEYDQLFKLIKQAFLNAAADSGQSFPLLRIREQLQKLINHIDSYHLLTFIPPQVRLEDVIYRNSILCAMSSYLLASWHGFPKNEWFPIALAGLLHDIGNMMIDPAILYKKSKLTDAERREMQQHTVYGYNILKNVRGLNEGIRLAALQHHEKVDGTGYPLGLKSDKIHHYAKVVAVTDIFHAMTSHRTYKEAESPYIVLEQLFNESFGKLDPLIVQTFIQKVTQLHNGTIVLLSDNSIGEIVFTDRNHPTRPLVNVRGNIINLATNRHLHIVQVIQKS